MSIDIFSQQPITAEQLQEAMSHALQQIDRNLEQLGDQFLGLSSENLIYPAIDNISWATGFWTGMIWLAYEVTGHDKYREAAERHVISFKDRLDREVDIDHHDLGFLYTLSCVSAYKLTGSGLARETALRAADHLLGRFKEKGAFIQAWGEVNNGQESRLIIDSLMNVPLLFWASETTGRPQYEQAAYEHVRTLTKHIFRPDGSTYHTYYFDAESGRPIKGVTHQGHSDSSCWARGQAWGIAGLPLSYRYTKDPALIDAYKNTLQYYLARLPGDYVNYWDLVFTQGDEPRDSSAAAIAVCGMLEMNKWVEQEDELKRLNTQAAQCILQSLMTSYTTKGFPHSNGLLLHAVYAKPQKVGVDECNIWGDYFYMEALVRLMKDWELYW